MSQWAQMKFEVISQNSSIGGWCRISHIQKPHFPAAYELSEVLALPIEVYIIDLGSGFSFRNCYKALPMVPMCC